jgi:hypothetical protein
MTFHTTRESWLKEAVDHLSALFAETKEEGEPVSVPPVHISCGFPATTPRKRIGECWSAEASEDGQSHIFVSPTLKDPIEILGVIVHELCHAIDNCESGHGGRFRKLATQMGLEGKMTSTHVGVGLAERLKPLVQTLGTYPHSPLQFGATKQKKQTTRMLKASCQTVVDAQVDGDYPGYDKRHGETCGYNIRTTQKWLEVAVPVCPVHEDKGKKEEVEET